MTTLPVIGKHELIDLHKEGILNVPAKIDTGADKCSIWATDIVERNGMLSFVFFGRGSALYTGTKVQTKEYVTTPVKNSFGVTEIRYMIKLSIRVADKTYRVRFTLADRSRNKFPVLLGMNFLKNHFWVNVAENYIQSPRYKQNNRNVLICYSSENSDWGKYFSKVSSLHKEPVTYSPVAIKNLVFWFDEHPKVTIGVDGKDIKEFPLAYLKIYKHYYEQRIAAAEYLRYENTRVIDEESAQGISTSKLSEMVKLNCHAVTVPKGVAMATELMVKQFGMIKKYIGLPFVLKDIYSERGQNNYLVQDEATFDQILREATDERYFVAQEYIENDGFVRLLVLNKEIPVVIKRTVHPHKNALKNHLNKPAGGANAILVNPSDMSEVCSIAMRAAMIMNRQVAGVDAIQDKNTKKWYILEANASPQLIGDKFEDEKAMAFAKFIDYELERS